MRRPINWFVFCIALLFLLVNLSAPGRRAHQPEIPVPMALIEARTATLNLAMSARMVLSCRCRAVVRGVIGRCGSGAARLVHASAGSGRQS